MKQILFVEHDKDIRDSVEDYGKSAPHDYQIRIVKTLAEASDILKREVFNSVLFDVIHPPMREVLIFIRDARRRDPYLPMLALVAYSDMILSDTVKETLRQERVSIVDKLQALKDENLSSLFESAVQHGLGEEL